MLLAILAVFCGAAWSQCPALDFDQRIDGGLITFETLGSARADWVEVHFVVNSGIQTNVKMDRAGDFLWTFPLDLLQGDVVNYFFTYCLQKIDCDTETFDYTPPPPAAALVTEPTVQENVGARVLWVSHPKPVKPKTSHLGGFGYQPEVFQQPGAYQQFQQPLQQPYQPQQQAVGFQQPYRPVQAAGFQPVQYQPAQTYQPVQQAYQPVQQHYQPVQQEYQPVQVAQQTAAFTAPTEFEGVYVAFAGPEHKEPPKPQNKLHAVSQVVAVQDYIPVDSNNNDLITNTVPGQPVAPTGITPP